MRGVGCCGLVGSFPERSLRSRGIWWCGRATWVGVIVVGGKGAARGRKILKRVQDDSEGVGCCGLGWTMVQELAWLPRRSFFALRNDSVDGGWLSRMLISV